MAQETASFVADWQHKIAQDPANPDLHYRLAEFYFKQKQYDEAIASYRKAIALNSHAFLFHHGLGHALFRTHQLDPAIQSFQTAIALNPDYSWSYQLLGESWLKKNELNQAIQSFQTAIALNPDFFWSHQLLADCLAKQGQSEQAIKSYRRAIQLDSNVAIAYEKLANSLLLGDFYWSHSWIENQLKRSGRFDEAVSCYERAVQLNPDNVRNKIQLGNLLTAQGRIDEAIPYYQQVIYQKAVKNRPHLAQVDWDFHHLRDPDFMIIGISKGGTTSLYLYLSQHPHILPIAQKETHFFSNHFNKGLSWYLSQFPPAIEGHHFLAGEASPSYLFYPDVAQKVWSHFPKIKLIVLLRNPADRAISHYTMNVNCGIEKRSLETAIDEEFRHLENVSDESLMHSAHFEGSWGYVLQGLYVYDLKRWMSYFPREQFLILSSEDFYQNTDSSYQHILRFLDLPSHQLSNYSNHHPGAYKNAHDDAQRQRLVDYFRPHNQKLEEFLGRSFGWT